MELPTGSQDSSAPSLAGLIQKNYTPGNGVNGNAPQFQNALRITVDDPVAPPPLPVVAPQPIGYMQVPAQPRMAAPQPQLSAPAQQYANAFQNNGQPMDNGSWMQRNLQMVQAEQALKAQQQQLQPQYEQLWRDSQRSQALQMLQQTQGTSEQNSLGALWAASVLGNQNNGMMNGGQYGMAAGNQSLSQLLELQRQGVKVPPQLLQAAYDQDYLWNMDGDTTSLKGIGSLQYKSMGISGGSYTGNNSQTAYGASAFDDNGMWNQNSGANHFEFDNLGYNKQRMDEIKRGWANDNRYSKNPMGSYSGPAGDGKNVHQYGNPRVDTGSNNNYQWQPPFLWPKDGDIQTNKSTGDGSYRYDDYSKYGAKQSKFDINNSQYIDRSGVLKTPTADQLMAKGMGQGYTLPAYSALSQVANAPEVKPLKIADPMWDVFSDDTRSFAKPPMNEQRYSNSFDRYAFDPVTGGVVEGILEKKAGKKK